MMMTIMMMVVITMVMFDYANGDKDDDDDDDEDLMRTMYRWWKFTCTPLLPTSPLRMPPPSFKP
jgi:hypothetical protein